MDKANTVVMDPAERNHLGVSFEFNNLSFPSVSNDSFRMTATSSAEGVKLWLESKKTKHQWQACIVKISDCGPAGIPEEVVFSFLQKSLQNVESALPAAEDHEVALESKDNVMSLKLTLTFGGMWKPEFIFTLRAVGLEAMDILEAKLRDAQEEISSLRAEVTKTLKRKATTATAPAFRKARNTSSVDFGGAFHIANADKRIIWDVNPSALLSTHFQVSEDSGSIFLLRTGVYHFIMPQHTIVMVNNKTLPNYDGLGHHIGRFRAGDELTIRAEMGGNFAITIIE